MTSKEKVLKKYPSAICYKVNTTPANMHWHVNIDGVCWGSQIRESWAWAEAARIVESESKKGGYRSPTTTS